MPSPSRATWLSVSAVLLNSSKFINFGCFGKGLNPYRVEIPFRSLELISWDTHPKTGGCPAGHPLDSQEPLDVLAPDTCIDVGLEVNSQSQYRIGLVLVPVVHRHH